MGDDLALRVTGQSEQAVKALNKIVGVVEKMDKRLGKIEKTNARMSRRGKKELSVMKQGYDSVKSSIGQVAVGLVGAQGLRSALTATWEGMKRIRMETIGFDDDLTSLLSLGDNVSNIDAVRASVLNMSAGFGISREKIVPALFDIQSNASSLSKTIQDDLLKQSLLLTKVSGGELNTNLRGLVKTYQIYEDQVESVTDTSNKLFKASELGAMTFDDLATFLPDVANAARVMDVPLNEVLASLIVATQLGGRNMKTFTGLRNVYLRMQKAMEMGLVTQGDFISQLREVNKLDRNQIIEIFGAEAIAVTASLASNIDKVQAALHEVESTTGNIAESKFFERMGDATGRYAEFSRTLDQSNRNVSQRGGGTQYARDMDMEFNLRKRGLKEMLPAFLHDSWLESFVAGVNQTIGGDADLRVGKEAYLRDLAVSNSPFFDIAQASLPYSQSAEDTNLFLGRTTAGNAGKAEYESRQAELLERALNRHADVMERNTRATEAQTDVAVGRRRKVGRNPGDDY